jgi:hypothetical protein
MRLAMLFHDTGKLLRPTPRRHSNVSARLFARFKPAWFPAHLVPLTKSLIRTHDVFATLCRSLTDKRGQPPVDYSVELCLPSSCPLPSTSRPQGTSSSRRASLTHEPNGEDEPV